MEQTSLRVGPKDIFMHLLAIITLYASAVSLAALLFQYINLAFPDVLRDAYYYRENALSAIRFAVSTLIVVFPVYFWSARHLRKLAEADPERRTFTIRKWLAYFTLFLAGGIAIGWLIAVINKFLEGDFTTAFILKALVIFFITGSTFFYYRNVSQGTEDRLGVRGFGYFIALVVLAAVVAAFFVVGSPAKRRMEKADVERLSNLQSIQNQIGNYYSTKQKLPESLTDLSGAFGDQSVQEDPVTGKDYEYIKKGDLSFELCATFDLAYDPVSSSVGGRAPIYDTGYFGPLNSDAWKHNAGRQCFTRNIDKDYFRNGQPVPIKY